jgi:hypothetical protein
MEPGDRVWVRYWKQAGILVCIQLAKGEDPGRLDVWMDSGIHLSWNTDKPATDEVIPGEMEGYRSAEGGPGDVHYAIIDPPHESYGMTRREEWEYIHRSMKELGWVP